MSLIQISGLTFAYEGSYDNIFENVSFQIDTDWKLGFIGRNGRGKTTFLKLLAGEYEYGGTISTSVSFIYFPFTVSNPALDTLEAVYEINSGFALWELERELSLLEVSSEVLYRPFNTLSHGERTKVWLATLFTGAQNSRFLLIDEPTDHLDAHAREIVAQYLSSKNGFILVSHDRLLLDTCIDHVLSINRGGIEVQSGNFTSWYQNRQQQDQYELEKNRRIKKEIKRLETTAREKATWSDKVENSKIGTHTADRGYVGHKAAKAMKRSKTIEGRIDRELDEKSKLLKNIEKVDNLTVTPLPHHARCLIELRNVALSYRPIGFHNSFYAANRTIYQRPAQDATAPISRTDAVFPPVCQDVTFTVERGERVALQGRNGCGKSSLIKLCLMAGTRNGRLPDDLPDDTVTLSGETGVLCYTGEVRTANGLVVSYVSQDTSHLSGNLTDYAQKNKLDESLFKAILRKLEFSRIQFDKDMRDFSSGQKKKVLIAQSLCTQAHVYIWDEPLNFVDVLSRVQIEELILAGQPTMLFVEHDSIFTQKIATKTVKLSSN